MGPLLVLAAITIVALLVVRIGAAALVLTGLSTDTARFQAYSAFFGVGFTTHEAELVVNHPVRRRIIRDLIIAGNIGVFSALTSVLVTFLREPEKGGLTDLHKALIIVSGALLLAFIAHLKPVRRLIDYSVAATLSRAGVLHPADYELLLRIQAGYCVSEVEIEADHWLVGSDLRHCGLSEVGLLVLGIARSDGTFIGAPNAATNILAGDVLTVYGRETQVHTLASPLRPISH